MNISDMITNYYEEREKMQDAYWDRKGKELGYQNIDCPNCGRYRVIGWENGDKICEKCDWNLITNNYEVREFENF